MSFPWGNLITAISTLVAGFGGISLKDWSDARRAREQRRRVAYLELMLSLDRMNRSFSAPHTLGRDALTGSAKEETAEAVGSVQQAYFSVFLTGAKRVQPLAGKAWQAAWDVQKWFDSADKRSGELQDLVMELEDLLVKLSDASSEFASAARREEAGRLPDPIPGRAGTAEVKGTGQQR